MPIAVIACHVLHRELGSVCARAGQVSRVFWLEQGLHDTPEKLRRAIQAKIDEIEAFNDTLAPYQHYRTFDAIVLGYGLCSNGTVGLENRRLPLIVPKCDDCIALFLGSQQRYLEAFEALEGVFWYNPGWIETSLTPSQASYQRRRQDYAELYGEENADFLLENELGWVTKYKSCGYIASPTMPNEQYEAYTRQAAQHFGWSFHRLEGDNTMLEKLLNRNWQDDDFLICPPGSKTIATYDGSKLGCEPLATLQEA